MPPTVLNVSSTTGVHYSLGSSPLGPCEDFERRVDDNNQPQRPAECVKRLTVGLWTRSPRHRFHPPRVCMYWSNAALTLWNQRTDIKLGRAVTERRRLGDDAVIFIKAPFSLLSLSVCRRRFLLWLDPHFQLSPSINQLHPVTPAHTRALVCFRIVNIFPYFPFFAN